MRDFVAKFLGPRGFYIKRTIPSDHKIEVIQLKVILWSGDQSVPIRKPPAEYFKKLFIDNPGNLVRPTSNKLRRPLGV